MADVYELSVFLETESDKTWILPSGWKPTKPSSWDRILLEQSTTKRQMLLRLRPLDTFNFQNTRFDLEYHDVNDNPYDSQVKVVNLEGES